MTSKEFLKGLNISFEHSQTEEVVRTLMEDYADMKLKRNKEWIKINNKMPKIEEIVWLYDGANIWIGGRNWVGNSTWLWCNSHGDIWYNNKKWQGALEADDDYQPTHWKPLPTLLKNI